MRLLKSLATYIAAGGTARRVWKDYQRLQKQWPGVPEHEAALHLLDEHLARHPVSPDLAERLGLLFPSRLGVQDIRQLCRLIAQIELKVDPQDGHTTATLQRAIDAELASHGYHGAPAAPDPPQPAPANPIPMKKPNKLAEG